VTTWVDDELSLLTVNFKPKESSYFPPGLDATLIPLNQYNNTVSKTSASVAIICAEREKESWIERELRKIPWEVEKFGTVIEIIVRVQERNVRRVITCGGDVDHDSDWSSTVLDVDLDLDVVVVEEDFTVDEPNEFLFDK